MFNNVAMSAESEAWIARAIGLDMSRAIGAVADVLLVLGFGLCDPHAAIIRIFMMWGCCNIMVSHFSLPPHNIMLLLFSLNKFIIDKLPSKSGTEV